jgi:hypothetical protein
MTKVEDGPNQSTGDRLSSQPSCHLVDFRGGTHSEAARGMGNDERAPGTVSEIALVGKNLLVR